MVQVGEYVAYRDGRYIVSRSGDGRHTVIVDLGDVVYVSEGDRTGHGRHILHRGTSGSTARARRTYGREISYLARTAATGAASRPSTMRKS